MNLMDLFIKISVDDQASKQVETIGSKLKGGLATAAKVGAAAITAATAATVAFAKSSIDAGMSFDSSMSQVAATMGTTVDQISELRDLAIEMGSSTAFTASQAADALNYMALAGYDANQAMEALPNVLNLAAAGGIELAAASDMVTDAQSALGLSMEESSIMVDQMAKTASKSNTSVAQLGEAILTVGGTASYMAGGTEQINKVLGVLADNGIKGAEAGTHLRNMLLSLSAPTADAQSIIDKFGLQIFDADGKMRDFADIFPELNSAMEGLTEQEKLDAFSKLFNTRDIASATALLNTSVERWDELGSAIVDSKGAAEAMASTQLDNLAGDITLFKSALEGAQIVLSDQLSPTLREFVQFGSDAISTLSTEFQEGGLSGAMDALGTILSDGLVMIIEMLPEFIRAGSQLLSSLVDGIIENLPILVESAAEIIVNLANGIAEMLPELIPTIVDVVLQIVETLIDNVDMLIDAAIEIIVALAEGLINALPNLIEKAPKIIEKLVNAIITNAPKLLDGGVRLIIALAGGLIKAIPKLVGKIPEIISAIVKGFKSGSNRILDVGKNIVQGVWEGIKSAAAWIRDKVTNFFGGIVDGVKDFLGIHSPSKVFAGIGGFMAEGLGVGFDDEFSDIKKNIENSMNFDAGTISGRYEMSAYSSPVAISEQNRVFSLLEKYLPMLANMKIVLDGGTVVGILAPEIDSALGKINAREARAV